MITPFPFPSTCSSSLFTYPNGQTTSPTTHPTFNQNQFPRSISPSVFSSRTQSIIAHTTVLLFFLFYNFNLHRNLHWLPAAIQTKLP